MPQSYSWTLIQPSPPTPPTPPVPVPPVPPVPLSQLTDNARTNVLRNFLFVLARQFDQLKVMIDQFVNVTRMNYTQFDQTPDALLEDVGRFFGWEFIGNFLSSSASQYVLGKGVLQGTAANATIERNLSQIKNEFWRRTLANLPYIYKTKGTRECVESLMRIYGINRNFVRLKEFGVASKEGIRTSRISSAKSSNALCALSSSVEVRGIVAPPATLELRLKFPLSTSRLMTPTALSGTIVEVMSGSTEVLSISYSKPSASSATGTIVVTDSLASGSISIPSLPFDERWLNVALLRDQGSTTTTIDVRSIDRGELSFSSSSVGSFVSTSSFSPSLFIARSPCECWAQELRSWSALLSETELDDHALNFQSYGRDDYGPPALQEDELDLHIRLDSASLSSGTWTCQDLSSHALSGTLSGSASPSFTTFLNEYNFIASPEYGWNEDKVKTFDSSVADVDEVNADNKTLALEFNMVDALNEDISLMISSLDTFNNTIGVPANRYRESYPDLEAMGSLYFSRLRGRLNFTAFADMLEFFDRSFVSLIRMIVPARTNFVGEELVVESHMLERPKLQWNYRRRDPEFAPLGVIKVYTRENEFGNPSFDRYDRTIHFANVAFGKSSGVAGDDRVSHVNTTQGILNGPIGIDDISGAIRSRKKSSMRMGLPPSVKG